MLTLLVYKTVNEITPAFALKHCIVFCLGVCVPGGVPVCFEKCRPFATCMPSPLTGPGSAWNRCWAASGMMHLERGGRLGLHWHVGASATDSVFVLVPALLAACIPVTTT